MDHIGIDVHKKDSQICILGAEGARASSVSARPPIGSPTSSATAPGPASSSTPRPRASGWRDVWKGWAMKSSSPTRTSRPCMPPGVARSRRIDSSHAPASLARQRARIKR
jgi:hypothetical protein